MVCMVGMGQKAKKIFFARLLRSGYAKVSMHPKG
jgi:hypothetical protein